VQDSKVIDDLVRQKLRKFANFTKTSKYMANKRLKTYRERIKNERRLNEESEKPKTTSTERVKRWRRKEEAVAHKWASVADGAVPSTSNAGIHLYTKDHVGEVCVVEVTLPNSFRFALASVYIHHNVSSSDAETLLMRSLMYWFAPDDSTHRYPLSSRETST
jgi:hypothetical protein